MKPWYQDNPPCFECTACGACCHGDGEEYVFLRPGEDEAIRECLELSADWFRRRYLQRFPTGELALRMRTDGACPFLGDDNRCAVYDARPMQCRSYPFWPELMVSAQTWRGEAVRCEGIDRGQRVPVGRIVAALKASG